MWVVTKPEQIVYKKGNKTSKTPKKGYKKTVIPEEGYMDSGVSELWTGSKDDVMAFEFGDGVIVNVIKSIDEDMTGEQVVYTEGTDGIDIIYVQKVTMLLMRRAVMTLSLVVLGMM